MARKVMTKSTKTLLSSTNCMAVNESQKIVSDGLIYLKNLPPLPRSYSRVVPKVTDPFEINNLRYNEPIIIKEQGKKVLLTPTAVKELLKKINALEPSSDKHFVIGVGTGGTIAMSPRDGSGPLEPDLDFERIMERADPRLKQEFEIIAIDAFQTDSSQLEIDDIGDLAIMMAYVYKQMHVAIRRRFAGFLVIHGTDTMPRSGAHLLTMLGRNMPFNVVHTGSQKPMNEKINDAEANVKQSLYTLAMLHKGGYAEGITVMGGKALLTIGISKVSDHRAQAMATLMHKEVLDFNELPDPDYANLPEWLRTTPGPKVFNPKVYRGPNRVAELTAEMQEDARAIVAALTFSGRKAILLTTYGANTYDRRIVKITAEAAKRQNIPVFAISPVNANPSLDTYGAGADMANLGVTPLYMTAAAARAKLMSIFTLTDSVEDVKEAMTDDVLGEIPNALSARSVHEY